jgi:serine/threonine protein kinase
LEIVWNYFYLFAIDKLNAEAGIGGFGNVFKVTNIKTKEVKVESYTNNGQFTIKNSEEFKIGMEIGRKCEYLVHYDKIFVEGDFEIIIMDYFEKGDLQSYLNKGNKLNESVCNFFSHFINFFFFFFC